MSTAILDDTICATRGSTSSPQEVSGHSNDAPNDEPNAPPAPVITARNSRRDGFDPRKASVISPRLYQNRFVKCSETPNDWRKEQKIDRADAALRLKLLMENRFPQVWVPNPSH
jgi:hypothetical protein